MGSTSRSRDQLKTRVTSSYYRAARPRAGRPPDRATVPPSVRQGTRAALAGCDGSIARQPRCCRPGVGSSCLSGQGAHLRRPRIGHMSQLHECSLPAPARTTSEVRSALPGINACYPLPATRYPLPATRYLLPATRYPLPATCYLLPATRYPLPATCYLLPATCYLLPATCYLLRATCSASRRKPITCALIALLSEMPSMIEFM